MHDFLIMLLTLALLFACVCSIRGLYDFCADAVRISRWFRNRKPDSVADEAVRSIMQDMRDNPSNWRTTYSTDTRYVSETETIRRADGQIKLSNYCSDGCKAIVTLDGLGKYGAQHLKPSVQDELTQTCRNYKDYLATVLILKPEAIKLETTN